MSIGYSSYSDPRLQPPDPDDRWVSIAEALEEKYGKGQELRERVDSVLFGLDLIADIAAIYEGDEADIPVAAERFVRRILGEVERRVEADAKEDAIAEVEEADEQARTDAAIDAWEARQDEAA